MSARPFSLLGLWPIINRWKYLVLAAVVLAAVVSAVVSLMLPNVYKSTAVFYPTNPQTTDPDRFVTPEGNKLELTGRTEDLDRVITIGNSQPVAEYIIRKYKLHKHYESGQSGEELADQNALDEFNSNLSIVHNDRDAIELTFLDEDKQLAARVANDMVSVIDSFNQQLTLENRRRVIDLYRNRYDSLRRSHERTRQELLAVRRRYNIFNADFQARYMAEKLVETEAALRRAEASGGDVAGLRRALRALTDSTLGNTLNMQRHISGIDRYQNLQTQYNDMQNRVAMARGTYESARVAITGKISSLYVVQKAYPAARKAKPIRWLIVVSSVVVTFGLSVMAIALLEAFRRTGSGRVVENRRVTATL